MMYGQGISQEGELLDMAVEQDIVDKSGAWYAYKGDRMVRGGKTRKNYMREHQEMMMEVFCSCSRCVRHWYRRNGH